MPPLDPSLIFTVLQLLAGVAGAWFAVKAQVAKLAEDQRETLRQIGALHKRLDGYGEEIRKLDKQTAVIWDRLNRATQRFGPPSPEIVQDVFGEGDEK